MLKYYACFPAHPRFSFQPRLVYLNTENPEQLNALKAKEAVAADWTTWEKYKDAGVDAARDNEAKPLYEAAKKRISEDAKREMPEKPLALPPNPTPDQVAIHERRQKEFEEIGKKVGAEEKQLLSQLDVLYNQIIDKIKIAFEAKKAVQLKLQENIKSALKGNIDKETLDGMKTSADFAADLADDGINIASVFKDKEVYNYKTSALYGEDEAGTKVDVEVKDYSIENIAMGAAFGMHEPGAEKDPAKGFIEGLSKREVKTADWNSSDLTGVRIEDIRDQVLGSMKMPMATAEDRADAKDTRAAKLIFKIIREGKDLKMSPQIQGMLMAKLITKGTTEYNKDVADQACNKVESMWNMLKATQSGRIDEIGGYEEHDVLYPMLATVGTYTVVGIPLVSYFSGDIDENALEKAGVVCKVLEDAENAKALEVAKAEYEQIKAKGGSNSEIEQLYAELKDHPSKIKAEIEKYKNAVALEKARLELPLLKKQLDHLADNYASLQISSAFPIKDSDYRSLLSERSAGTFSTGLKALKEKLAQAESDPRYLKAAMDAREDVNKKIPAIKGYRDELSKHPDNKLPKVDDFEPIVASSPEDILKALGESKAKVEAAFKIVVDNQAALEKLMAEPVPTADPGKGGSGSSENPGAPAEKGPIELEDLAEFKGKKIKIHKGTLTQKPSGYTAKSLNNPKKILGDWIPAATEKLKTREAGFYPGEYEGKKFLAEVRKDKAVVYHNAVPTAEPVAQKKEEGKAAQG